MNDTSEAEDANRVEALCEQLKKLLTGRQWAFDATRPPKVRMGSDGFTHVSHGPVEKWTFIVFHDKANEDQQ